MASNILTGTNTSWSLLDRLGEGDAGEVFRVEPLLGGRTGILKRPHRSAFHGEVIRQANQIWMEGQMLEVVSEMLSSGLVEGICVPRVLDTSKPGSEHSDRLFIVIEEAQGFDLALLMRVARFGLNGLENLASRFSPGEMRFLEFTASSGRLPVRVLLAALSALLNLLPRLHSHPFKFQDVEFGGLIWNDVKPEHIFWNALDGCFTIIDWGNAQLLDTDGTTRDRRGSRLDDVRQMIEEMGRFLSNAAPELHTQLSWPSLMTPGALSDETLQVMGWRVAETLAAETSLVREARTHEEALLAAGISGPESLLELDDVHTLLLSIGLVPDYAAARHLAAARAVELIRENCLADLGPLSAWAARLPAERPGPWELVSRLSVLKSTPLLLDALQAALSEDTETVLWNLALSLSGRDEPPWWYELTDELRRLILGQDIPPLRPLTAANRLYLGLQAAARQSNSSDPAAWFLREGARRMREEALPAWTQTEPSPPHSGLQYSELDEIAAGLVDAQGQPLDLPDLAVLRQALAGPRETVAQALAAWEAQDFPAVQAAIRRLLAWDPERRRVLRADAALKAAPAWLERARQGPQRGAGLTALVTDLEFEGRELRNFLGPAGWIDDILDALRKLRRGVWPSALLEAQPGLRSQLPWLARFDRTVALAAPAGSGENAQPLPADLKGMKQAALGPGGELCLLEPLDAWTPEARGSSARVFLATLPGQNKTTARVALKLMRPDKTSYALPLFREEAIILSLLKDVPGVVGMLECGFLQVDGLEPENPLPSGDDPRSLGALAGPAVRIGPESVQIFLNLLEARSADGWIPYLALPIHPQEENLIHRCDAGRTAGRFEPVPELVQMCIQILEIMEAAHSRSIVYRDHKILHYYWTESANGIDIIDWNVARYHPDGLTQMEKNMDLVQFGARGLHHILTGRSAPGALPLGPTRPEEIESAAQSYQPQWTYDDNRLSEELKSIIEAVLAGSYSSAAALRDDLKSAYMRL